MTENQQSTSEDRRRLIEEMRVLIVAGIPVGVLVAGMGSRLAMLLLRVVSPDRDAENDYSRRQGGKPPIIPTGNRERQ